MDIKKSCEKAEELVRIYNPDGISPFPFEKIVEKEDKLANIYYSDSLPDEISGAIIYNLKLDSYSIHINKNKNSNRKHFTTAHEIGHFFLHKDIIKREEAIIDDGDSPGDSHVLYMYSSDNGSSTDTEKEANHFASALIMPSELVTEAWEAIGNVEECAKIFNVSISAMSIRLEILKLINE
ncbi:MAG: ImmA/IrrE family metallo-endopeptidase [Candidatus Moraniibacteriota bacterium]